jgi:RNA polymerase sigma-70 factor (ECF subfamily)
MQRERGEPNAEGALRPVTAKQERAYTDAVSRHYARIYAFLFHLTQDAAMAEDLTQETYAAAWRSLHQFEGRGSSYLWLHQIALNCYRQWLRRYRPELEALDEDEFVSPDPGPGVIERLDDEHLRKRASSAVALLPENYREAVILKCYQGLKYREMAELLGVPMGTVQFRVHTALDKLRAILKEEVGTYETDLVHDA